MFKWVKKQCKHYMIANKEVNEFNDAINNFIKDKEIISVNEFTANVDLVDKEGNKNPMKLYFAGITYKE